MSKHQKGPWRRDKYGAIVDLEGNDVLFRSVSTLSCGTDERMKMAEANTDLAAAAHDLLDALEKIKVRLEVYLDDERDMADTPMQACLG